MQNGQRSESSQDPAEKDTTTHRRRKEIFPAAMRIAPTVEPGAHRRPRITTPIPWHHRSIFKPGARRRDGSSLIACCFSSRDQLESSG